MAAKPVARKERTGDIPAAGLTDRSLS